MKEERTAGVMDSVWEWCGGDDLVKVVWTLRLNATQTHTHGYLQFFSVVNHCCQRLTKDVYQQIHYLKQYAYGVQMTEYKFQMSICLSDFIEALGGKRSLRL